MKFKYIVSLGYNCSCAYQVRLHTGIDDALFFDWIYTSIEAAQHMIKTDFVDFLRPERVEIVRDGTEILVRPSGIRLNHSFKPDGKNVDAEIMRRDFELEKAKFEHLASKMRQIFAANEPIAFIRYNPHRGHYDAPEKVARLAETIERRLGHGQFLLYWVKNSGQTGVAALTDRIASVDIDEQPSRSTSFRGGDFAGSDDVAWGEFLGGLELDLRLRRGEPGHVSLKGVNSQP